MENWLESSADCEEQYYAIKSIQKNMNEQFLNNQLLRSNCFGFIYEKENENIVLNFDDSKKYNSTLIKEGWKHTDTVDLPLYVEYLIKTINFKKK